MSTERRDQAPPYPGNAHVIEGIRSLHGRIDELERLLAERREHAGAREQAGGREHAGAREHAGGQRPAPPQVPAWQRPTEGEARWPVTVCTAAAIALQIAVPGRLDLVRPAWILPALQGALLAGLFVRNPHRINRPSPSLRWLSLALAALLSVANARSVVQLVIVIAQARPEASNASRLLITGAAIWLTNVIAFALWYWEFDRGGPVARAQATKPYPDFQFPQMLNPDMAPPRWEPAFTDYLYLAFTNASAFSPTDVMPLSRWAKMAMTVQSAVSIVTVVLVVARAVTILR